MICFFFAWTGSRRFFGPLAHASLLANRSPLFLSVFPFHLSIPYTTYTPPTWSIDASEPYSKVYDKSTIDTSFTSRHWIVPSYLCTLVLGVLTRRHISIALQGVLQNLFTVLSTDPNLNQAWSVNTTNDQSTQPSALEISHRYLYINIAFVRTKRVGLMLNCFPIYALFHNVD